MAVLLQPEPDLDGHQEVADVTADDVPADADGLEPSRLRTDCAAFPTALRMASSTLSEDPVTSTVLYT
jgi:hypothetical protein